MAKQLPTFKAALPTRCGNGWGTMLDPGAEGSVGELVAVFSRRGKRWVAELLERVEVRDGREVWSTLRSNKRHRKGQAEPVPVAVVEPHTVTLPDPDTLTPESAAAILKALKPAQGYSLEGGTVEARKQVWNRRANGTIKGMYSGAATPQWESYRLDVVEAARRAIKRESDNRFYARREYGRDICAVGKSRAHLAQLQEQWALMLQSPQWAGYDDNLQQIVRGSVQDNIANAQRDVDAAERELLHRVHATAPA